MKKMIYIYLTFIFIFLLFNTEVSAKTYGYINYNTSAHEIYVYGNIEEPVAEAELICSGVVVESFSNEGSTVINRTIRYDNLYGVYSCNVIFTSNGIARKLLDNDVNVNFGEASSSENSNNSNNENNTSSDISGNCSVLGSFKGDLQEIFKMIRIFAPLLVGVITAYEYLSALFMKNADALKKANNRLIKRLFLIAALWFLPTFLNIVLDLLEGDYSSCIN